MVYKMSSQQVPVLLLRESAQVAGREERQTNRQGVRESLPSLQSLLMTQERPVFTFTLKESTLYTFLPLFCPSINSFAAIRDDQHQ